MNNDIYIRSYYGFGDNIFMYPFIKEACKKYNTVYLKTHFPFLFWALPNIKFVRPSKHTSLIACKRSLSFVGEEIWTPQPEGLEETKFGYYLHNFESRQNLIETFNQTVQIEDREIDFTLPIRPEWIIEAKNIINTKFKTNKKICLIKPPSDRKDWRCPARVPNPEYFQYLIDKYKDDYYFVTIGNKNTDVYVQELENIDTRFDNGELEFTTIIGLSSLSDMIICYNCFFFPLGVATKTKTLVINGGYTDPRLYVDYNRLDLSKLRIVTPNPCCVCVNLQHNCNKDIPLKVIDEEMESLIKEETPLRLYVPSKDEVRKIHKSDKHKKNLLICRMRADNCAKIARNSYIKEDYNIITVDHTPLFNYRKYPYLFKANYQFPSVGDICRPIVNDVKEQEIYEFCISILKKHEISQVLNAQPLHPYNTILNRACRALQIDTFNTEIFCDDKWLLDRVGCQYTDKNEIFTFVNTIPLNDSYKINLPQSTRQDQPQTIRSDNLYKKYGLSYNHNYIVLLGQLLWDMSVKQTISPDIKTYENYVELVIRNNPNTKFLVKYHPIYKRGGKQHEMNFFKKYPNVIIIDESLDTLFNTFPAFTSFSSTTILEGIIKNKSFATIGYHYCNNDDLVIQLRSPGAAVDLSEKLKRFRINPKTRNRYLRFICNYYTIDLESEQLYKRLTLSSNDYFSQEY